jgi:hypothetical protein
VAHVTIEYVIMVPLLISQIFLLPWAASVIMNGWVDSRRTLALQETASHLGSSIQQTYLSLNYTTISAANVTSKLDVPPFIEGYAYTTTTTLEPASGSKVLELTLTLKGVQISSTAAVTLGQNVAWREGYSSFMSNSTSACLRAEKDGDSGMIELYFEP